VELSILNMPRTASHHPSSHVHDPATADVRRQCWCGSGVARPAGSLHAERGQVFPLVRCAGCGVYALQPQPSVHDLLSFYTNEYYGASPKKFTGPVAAFVSFWQSHRARVTARLVPEGGRILDVGCGNGGYLRQMKRRGFVVEGTEWTARSAARVPAAAAIPVHVGDLMDLDLPDATYDLITMWHVLEHLSLPHEALVKIKRLLKPGGSLVLSLPNAESRQAQRFQTAWFHHDPPRHLFNFGPKSLARLLQMTGYRVRQISTFSLEQNVFGFIQSWLNARGFPRDRLYMMLKGFGKQPARVRILDLFRLLALLGPALLVSTIESIAGRGATMTIQARRPPMD
jgi:SAM-dependent methyltransferase